MAFRMNIPQRPTNLAQNSFGVHSARGVPSEKTYIFDPVNLKQQTLAAQMSRKPCKSLLWNGNVTVGHVTPTKILDLPYDGEKYCLNNIDFILRGSGEIKFIIRDTLGSLTVYEGSSTVTSFENNLILVTKPITSVMPLNHTILGLYAQMESDSDDMQVIGVELSM